jgi:hypothetical protein
MAKEPCKPCAAARRHFPAALRKRLEQMEQRSLERKARKEAERGRRQA